METNIEKLKQIWIEKEKIAEAAAAAVHAAYNAAHADARAAAYAAYAAAHADARAARAAYADARAVEKNKGN